MLSVTRPPVGFPVDGAPVVADGLGVAGVSIAGAELGLTGVPGLVPVSARGVDAALGLTGEPGFAAVSAPVAGLGPALSLGDALGLLVFDCAIRLQVSKSACVGSAASAAVELTRKTLATRTMRALILFIQVSSLCLTSNRCAGGAFRLDGVRAAETGPAIAHYRDSWPVQFTPELF